MASPRSVKAGEAFVELNVKNNLQKGLRAAETRIRKFGDMVTRIGGALFRLGAGIGALGVASATALTPAIIAAGNFQETLSRFDTLFGTNKDSAKDFAESFVKDFGRSRKEMMDMMTGFQGFLLNTMEPDEALKMTKKLTQATIDFASAMNLTDEEAMTKILSGMSGESEPLKLYVDMKAGNVNKMLEKMGIDPKVATELDKVNARFKLLDESFNKLSVWGDLLRTSDSFNNAMKSLKGTFDNLIVAIGKPLLEPLAKFGVVLATVLRNVTAWAEKNPELVKKIALFTAGAIALAGVLLGLSGVFLLLGLGITALMVNLAILLPLVATGVSYFFGWTKTLYKVGKKTIHFSAILKALRRSWLKFLVALHRMKKAFNTGRVAVLAFFASMKPALTFGKAVFRAFLLFEVAIYVITEALNFLWLSVKRIFTAIANTIKVAVQKVTQNWGAMVAFFKAGDMESAFKVITGVALVTWYTFVLEMKKAWADITAYFPNKFSSAVTTVAQMIMSLHHFFETLFIGLGSMWDAFINSVKYGAAYVTARALGASPEEAKKLAEAENTGKNTAADDFRESKREMEEGIQSLENELNSLMKSREANTAAEEESIRLLEEELALLRKQSREIEKRTKDGTTDDYEDRYKDEPAAKLGSSRGIFNARAIGSLRTTTVDFDKEIAENTRKSAEELRKIFKGLTTKEAGKLILG